MNANELSGLEASRLIAEGKLSSSELVQACNARIAAREPDVRAWLCHDANITVAAARRLDEEGLQSPLHGLPIGIKDIIDTADMPTTYNCEIYRGRRPVEDAECVAILRAKGAVIMGKTDTVEFACAGRNALTRNPHDLARTPGGSSSGSAAAVADFMVPFGLGTQTGGSHIRPAAYTGIYAFKPTWGLVNRAGVRMFAPSLDTVGWYARTPWDLALVASALGLYPSEDVIERQSGGAAGKRIGLCKTPFHHAADPAILEALATAGRRLENEGAQVDELELPAQFATLDEVHATVMFGEGHRAFLSDCLLYGDRLHQDFKDLGQNSRGITGDDLWTAYRHAEHCRLLLDNIFDRYDAILAPAAPGEAPLGLGFTGSIQFNALWTLMQVPCIAVPAGKGRVGMPLGLQLIGRRLSDARLLDIAAQLCPLIDPVLRRSANRWHQPKIFARF